MAINVNNTISLIEDIQGILEQATDSEITSINEGIEGSVAGNGTEAGSGEIAFILILKGGDVE